MTKSPSRTAGYSAALTSAILRHGLICFLCGQVHSRSDTLQPDYIKPLDGGGLAEDANTVPVCKTCAKRRNRRPLGVYFKQRQIEAQRELDYLRHLREDPELFIAMAATVSVVPQAVTGTGATEAPPANPWDGLTPTLYLETLCLPGDYDRMTDRPKNPKHGDVYQYADYHTGEIEEIVFNAGKGKWNLLSKAQEREEFPAEWPPADAIVWRQ